MQSTRSAQGKTDMKRRIYRLRQFHLPALSVRTHVTVRITAFLLACFVAVAPVIAVHAQSRYPVTPRRDRRPTREINIRYPTTTTESGGYIHQGGVVPAFRPGPSAPTQTPNLSDESGRLNDTPNRLRPR